MDFRQDLWNIHVCMPNGSKEILENAIGLRHASVTFAGSIIISDMWSSYTRIEELLEMHYNNTHKSRESCCDRFHTQTIDQVNLAYFQNVQERWMWHSTWLNVISVTSCCEWNFKGKTHFTKYTWLNDINKYMQYYMVSLNSGTEILNKNSYWINVNFSNSAVARFLWRDLLQKIQ